MTKFRNILVANRGEIAVRVMRTAKALGYRTAAVYSAADADAVHVQLADAAAHIGEPSAADSYLNVDRILQAARETGADAVHPGYGFLSENAAFARACEDAGLVFIGPTPDAIELMGNKAHAKRHMIDAGVPCVPGSHDEDQSDAALLEAGAKIGFPVMVKAAAGGGGRGMRLVPTADELPAALQMARSESEAAFGSGDLILEKAIIRPRHVEIQVFADTHGNAIYLGERDCSIQRRHQKVIEEAPCPIMTNALRERMGQAAVDAAQSIGYRGAGTVEFLLDEEGEFYFLEMNTRLQVEHPVTEMITGLDLVAMQLQVAQGQELGMTQEDVRLSGHAIEVRLYAEDPAQDFLPSPGSVDLWRPPAGEGIRVDSGIRSGLHISPYYDPLVAKIVAHGETREQSRRRLIEALENTVLFGTPTNRDFLLECLRKDTFAQGAATTAFIAEEFGPGGPRAREPEFEQAAMAAVLQYQDKRDAMHAQSVIVSPELMNWSSVGGLSSRYQYRIGERLFDLTVMPNAGDSYAVAGGEREIVIDLHSVNAGSAVLGIEGKQHAVFFQAAPQAELRLSTKDAEYIFRNLIEIMESSQESAGSGSVVAPMHGKILEISVEPGDPVEKGSRLAILEAMKMQHEILAVVDGVVREVLCQTDVQVSLDDPLFEIEVAET